MLITPHPGADRSRILEVLRQVHQKVDNLRRPYDSAFEHLLAYLEWATEAARPLRNQISRKDIDRLIFTPRYEALLSSCGTLAGTAQQRLVNGLVDIEVDERSQAFEEAETALADVLARWTGTGTFVVADSSFYIQNPVKLADADLHDILGLGRPERIHLLFPMTVVDELDGLKESGKHRSRWRAAHTLGVLDQTLNGATHGIFHHADSSNGLIHYRGEVTVEIVLDQPGHVRLPIEDDEIIDRAVAIQALAGRPIRLLTCDTGQHTRGCAADLRVTKIATKDPGPEPDWEEQDKPGNGGRARRRAKQAEQEARDAEQRPPEETA